MQHYVIAARDTGCYLQEAPDGTICWTVHKHKAKWFRDEKSALAFARSRLSGDFVATGVFD